MTLGKNETDYVKNGRLYKSVDVRDVLVGSSAVNDAEEAAGRAEAAADLAENDGRSIENMPPNFSTSSSYSVGDYVSYEGSIYRFITNHPAGTWNNNHVTAYI